MFFVQLRIAPQNPKTPKLIFENLKSYYKCSRLLNIVELKTAKIFKLMKFGSFLD